jgi:hypothetical protein
MGYSNINATPNYQLQGFGQSGMRTISTSQAYVEGEYYRVLVATQDSTISATSVIGDDITDLQVYAGTTIYGLFTAVSVSVGEVTAYLAGATDIESVWSYINTYGLNNGAIIEAADCAKDAIEPLLDKYYAQASLVLVPSLYKTSVVYAERPLDANGQLTFTRASEATRVGPDGYVEKVRTNLVLQSQTFDNASWTKTTDGQVTITANAAVAPDGTTTAEKMIPSAIAGFHCVAQTITLSASETSFSIFAKAAENSFLQIFDALTTEFANFNLTTGVVGSTNTYVASIESVGNGWYRCKATKAAPSGSFILRYGVVTSASAVRGESFTGNGTDGLLIWGAQAETGDIATNYIPTTTTAVSVGPVSNLPRLNYPINADGSVGCPSLLLEPQRTNTLALSEQFDNAYFIKASSSITANAAISPSGYQDADKLVPDTSNAIHSVYASSQPIVGGIYSVFAKADGYNWILLTSHPSSSPAARGAFFNVGNGTIGTAAAGINAKIENYGNGWYRCSINEGGSPSTIWSVIPTNADNVTTFAGNGTDGVLIWGGQNEQGSYDTSYIPTLGASVTRNADACSKTGISSLIGQTEGTLFAECAVTGIDITNSRRIVSISDGTTSNAIVVLNNANSTNLSFAVVNAGSIEVSILATSVITFGQTFKMAFAYKNNDFAVYLNGQQIGTDTSGTVPATSKLAFDRGNNTFAHEGTINQALLFKTRLTNDQLAELTSL